MKVKITEYLQIDLETENWVCRCCDAALISAHENYKKGTLIHARDPREIHRPLISEEDFRYTFAPDPELCVIYEFYCPSCGVLIETEYQVPGHMPIHDIELDIPALKAQWAERQETQPPYMGPDVEFMPNRDHPHHHHQ
jgi:acetone carboxylase, gamma subunit